MSMGQWIERGKKCLQRFWVHRQNNQQITWLAEQVSRNASQAPSPSKPGSVAPVIFFNASTRLSGVSLNAAYSLLSSWAVRLAGAPVIHFICDQGMSRCVLGASRKDPHLLPPCRECVRQSNVNYGFSDQRRFRFQIDPAVEQELAKMDLAALMEVEIENIPLGRLVLPSVRWVLRRHHLQADEPTLFLYRQFLLSAWWIAQEFTRLLDDARPQAVVVFNGISFPEAVACWIARQRGVKVITHEVCHQPLSAFFSNGEATAYRIEIPPDFELDPQQAKRLDAYLEQRFQGNFSMAGIRFWPEMRKLSPEFLERVSKYKQVVPIFTNVIFDTSQSHSNVVFEHMFAWLDLVLEIIQAHPETLFVIRAHPDEMRAGKESQESVAEWVKSKGVDQLPNVWFVDAQEQFSSYELIQRSKFVMLYNSTIGLEAALMGAAVLCGGKARFTQIPTVFLPPTPEEYRQKADEFLVAERIEVPPEFIENARRFMYYNLFRYCLPFGDYLENDGIWPGYVSLKSFDYLALLGENSPTLQVITDGILKNKPFIMEDTKL
jgi:hypothetical protein